MDNVFRFPGASEPTAVPNQEPVKDPFVALFETAGRVLLDIAGDKTLAEMFEEIGRMPAKQVIQNLFSVKDDEGDTNDDT